MSARVLVILMLAAIGLACGGDFEGVEGVDGAPSPAPAPAAALTFEALDGYWKAVEKIDGHWVFVEGCGVSDGVGIDVAGRRVDGSGSCGVAIDAVTTAGGDVRVDGKNDNVDDGPMTVVLRWEDEPARILRVDWKDCNSGTYADQKSGLEVRTAACPEGAE